MKKTLENSNAVFCGTTMRADGMVRVSLSYQLQKHFGDVVCRVDQGWDVAFTLCPYNGRISTPGKLCVLAPPVGSKGTS